MTPARDPWRELARLVGLVLAAVVVARMVGRLGEVVGLVLLAGTVAMLTAPVRRRLGRWMPGGLATALTAVATFAVVLVIGGLLMRELAVQLGRLGEDALAAIDGLRPGTLPARIATSLDAGGGVEEVLGRLPAAVVTGEDDTVGLARKVIDTLLVVILAAFFQASATSGLNRVVQYWPRSARAAMRDGVSDVLGRGVGYVRRLIVLGVGSWVLVGGVAFALGLPSPLLIGAWAGLWSVLPWVGFWVGATPFVVAAVVDGGVIGVVGSVAAVACWLAIGEARRRLVEDHRLLLGAGLTAVAVAAGIAIGGFGGLAVCLTVVAIVAAVATSEHRFVRPSRSGCGDLAVDPVQDEAERDAPHAVDVLLVRRDDGVAIAPGVRGALTVLGAVVVGTLAWTLLGHLGGVMVWLAVALLVALALHRPVSWIERRTGVPRFAAIGAVSVIAASVVAAAALLGLAGWSSSSEELSSGLPTVVEDMQTMPVVGPWLEERDAALWVSDQLENLPQRLREVRDVSDWLPAVGAQILGLFWVVVLAMALLVDGPRLTAAVERRIPARHRRQAVRLGAVSHAAVGGYLAGAALVAGINAMVVLVLALGVGIALAPVLAVWAFVWNFVPQIGGFMGGFPLVVLALAEGPLQAVAVGLLFLAYQLVENHLIQPAVISEAIDVPAWVALLGALGGGAAAGVVGAVVLTPLIGMIRVAVREVGRDDFPGTMVSIEQPPPAEAAVAAAAAVP